MPRPAGRRWARLRRGGSRATQMIARVTRGRGSRESRSGDAAHVVFPRPDRSWRRMRTRGPGIGTRVAPAVAAEARTSPVRLPPDELPVLSPGGHGIEPDQRPTPVTIPLLPGERT